jgi:hypothetical protein
MKNLIFCIPEVTEGFTDVTHRKTFGFSATALLPMKLSRQYSNLIQIYLLGLHLPVLQSEWQ